MNKNYSFKGFSFLFCCVLTLISFNGFAQVGIGTTDPKATLDVNGALSLREGPELALSNANNANILLGTALYSQYRIIGPTANFNILTFNVSAADGQLLTLINTTTYKMTIVHNTGSNGNQQRRIFCPGGNNLVLDGQNSTVTLQYNLSLLRWVVVGYNDVGGYGRNVYNALGATDINTNSASFSDMEDMSITFTPSHSVVYVNFSASGDMDKGSGNTISNSYANFQLMKDNVSLSGTTTLATDRSFLGSACSGTPFYDSGGQAGDYSIFENIPTIYSPANPGEKVSVQFTLFDVEEGWDGLMVYDGPNASSPLISSGSTYGRATCPDGAWTGFGAGAFSAQGITFTSTAPNGELYFVFTSDDSVNYAGWEACQSSGVTPPAPTYSLDTAWNAGFTMFPVAVTPGVPTTIKIRWLRDGLVPNVLRNNVTDKNRFHRSLTIID